MQLSKRLSPAEGKELGLMLNLELADLKCIEQDNKHNSKHAIFDMLERWRQRSSGNVHQLVEALKEIGRNDLVDIVRLFCAIGKVQGRESRKEIFV